MCVCTITHTYIHTYSISQKWAHPHTSAINPVYLSKGQHHINETRIHSRAVNAQPAQQQRPTATAPPEITQHTATTVKKAGNKTEYTPSDNSYTSFNHAKPHVLFIMFMFCLLDRTIQICVSCFRAVKIWFFEYNSLTLYFAAHSTNMIHFGNTCKILQAQTH